MPYSINGIGTKFYGKAEKWPDGTYITTKWVVILFVPLIPLGSYRVKKISGDGFFHSQYLTQEAPLHNRQVVITYGIVGLIVIIIYALSQFT